MGADFAYEFRPKITFQISSRFVWIGEFCPISTWKKKDDESVIKKKRKPKKLMKISKSIPDGNVLVCKQF
jgi:hypothetical protein